MHTSSCRTYFPISRSIHRVELKSNQRYRHPFSDLRLGRTAKRFLSRLISKQTSILSRCTRSKKEAKCIYRFLSNDRVTLEELTHYVTDLTGKCLKGKDIYAFIDSSSINLSLGPRGHSCREAWATDFGVIGDNQSPGFNVTPSLLKDAQTGHILGLGDILTHSRPKATGSKKENRAASRLRQKLPLEQKESGVWSDVACGTSAQLKDAYRVTYIMDQGGDDYSSLVKIQQQTGHDFIVRSKHDRLAHLVECVDEKRLETLLSEQAVSDSKTVTIKSLNHYSKTASAVVQRSKREGLLHLKMIEVRISKPRDVKESAPTFGSTIWVVEAREDPSTVPAGEEPIYWRMLTSWNLESPSCGWKVMNAYQQRWDVEQLFRVLKTQGFEIEKSQLDHPDKIKKLTIMALAASTKVLQLVAARNGKDKRTADEVFSSKEIKAMSLMLRVLNGTTLKTQNPHENESLAWAAWIIGRAGGWHGYESQRPPGPITMTRGLQELETLVAYQVEEEDP